MQSDWTYGASPAANVERFLVPRIFHPWAVDLIARVPPQPSESVLDLACGSGAVARVALDKVTAQGFVITFRSIAPREAVAPADDPFRALVERGGIGERQHNGLLHVQEHGTIARREYVALTGVSERTATNDLADLVRKGLLKPTGGRGRRTAYRLRDEAG